MEQNRILKSWGMFSNLCLPDDAPSQSARDRVDSGQSKSDINLRISDLNAGRIRNSKNVIETAIFNITIWLPTSKNHRPTVL